MVVGFKIYDNVLVNDTIQFNGIFYKGTNMFANANEINKLDNLTPGISQNNKIMILGENGEIDYLAIDDKLTYNGIEIIASANEINLLSGVTPGIAKEFKAAVVDSFNNIDFLSLVIARSNYVETDIGNWNIFAANSIQVNNHANMESGIELSIAKSNFNSDVHLVSENKRIKMGSLTIDGGLTNEVSGELNIYGRDNIDNAMTALLFSSASIKPLSIVLEDTSKTSATSNQIFIVDNNQVTWRDYRTDDRIFDIHEQLLVLGSDSNGVCFGEKKRLTTYHGGPEDGGENGITYMANAVLFHHIYRTGQIFGAVDVLPSASEIVTGIPFTVYPGYTFEFVIYNRSFFSLSVGPGAGGTAKTPFFSEIGFSETSRFTCVLTNTTPGFETYDFSTFLLGIESELIVEVLSGLI